jgi:hypothetical protein
MNDRLGIQTERCVLRMWNHRSKPSTLSGEGILQPVRKSGLREGSAGGRSSLLAIGLALNSKQ